MASFTAFLPGLLLREGGYSNDPDDTGGETYCGISRKNWPHWLGWHLVDAENAKSPILHNHIILADRLTKQVADFYLTNFWNPLRCDEIEFQATANMLCDFAVNSGIVPALKNSQKAIGVESDGKIGPNTLAALNSSSSVAGKIAAYRMFYLAWIVSKNPVQAKFIGGWANRVESLLK